MSVILLILKIIGWILLTLPALFLLIVFLVLVVPVRYRTDGSIEENILSLIHISEPTRH